MLPGWIALLPIILVYGSVVFTWVLRRILRRPDQLHQQPPERHHPASDHDPSAEDDLSASHDDPSVEDRTQHEKSIPAEEEEEFEDYLPPSEQSGKLKQKTEWEGS